MTLDGATNEERARLLDTTTDDNEDENSFQYYTRDFTELPWYRRPALFWVLIPYLIMALAFGGIIAPRMQLITHLVCRRYTSPDHKPPSSDDCRSAKVAQRVSLIMTTSDVLTGVLSAIVAPRLGALSDKLGRKPIFVLCSLGFICGEVILLAAALHPTTAQPEWIFLASILEGLTGSAVLAMAMVNTYVADCTHPQSRVIAMNYLHACTFVGLAVGPILAGYVVERSGDMATIFQMMLASHICCTLFVLLFTPESVSARRRKMAREKMDMARTSSTTSWVQRLRGWNPLGPLSVLRRRERGHRRCERDSLANLVIMDTIMFGVAIGSINVLLVYVNYQFGWQTFDIARYMTVVNSARIAFLTIIAPGIVFLYNVLRPTDTHNDGLCGLDNTDLLVVRIGILFETLGWIGYSASPSGFFFTASGIIQAVGTISLPALQSALTKQVPASETGKLFGAIGLLHSLTQIIAPILINTIFTATLGSFPQMIFICLSITFTLVLLLSFLVTPIKIPQHPPRSPPAT